jgi:hypothetical protein
MNMKKLIIVGSILFGALAAATPTHKVTGWAFGLDGLDNVESEALYAMNVNAANLCEAMGTDNAERVSDISLHTRYIPGSYGRMTATASALFICN